jgi:cell wall-associated NlpC family hydrolase
VPSRSTRAARAVAAAALLGALGVGLAGPAGAAPATETAAPGRDLGVLNEQYNLSRLRLDRASAVLNATEQRLAATRTRVEQVRTLVRARSASLYEGASGDGLASVLQTDSVDDLGRRTQYVAAAAKPDQALLRGLSSTLGRLTRQEQTATAARDRLRAETEAAAAARRKLMAEAAAAAAAKVTPHGDGAGPVGTPRALLVASSATGSTARTGAGPVPAAPPHAAPVTTPHPPSSPPPPPAPQNPNPPSPSSRAAVAVAYARAQLGKPYVFATAGPNTFDCSGLTMAAWRAAGVGMAHYSGSQAAAFPKVGWSQLQPGDIVVFYSDYHHVGLYIGGGMMIHAPQTGDVVKISPAWRETFQFGVRPG